MRSNDGYIPKHCRHKAKDLGYVRLNGKCLYTGPWGSEDATEKYDRLIGRWLAYGRELPQQDPSSGPYLIEDLAADYWEWFKTKYQSSREPESLKYAMRPLLRLYGDLAADDFRPRHLEGLQDFMVDEGLARSLINNRITKLKRMFRWGVRREKLDPSTHERVRSVESLRRGQTQAKEPVPVRPVSREHVEGTLPHLSRQVAAMVELQWNSGMRPGEVVRMKPCEIDRSECTWVYRPTEHKTKHRGHPREVYLNMKCQEILRPFMLRRADAYLFSPEEADDERRKTERRARKSKITPSQRARGERASRRASVFSASYDVHAYARAIARAAKKAGVPHWSPNRLRHSFATRVRKEEGIDAARVLLGHRSACTTEIYADLDREKALRVIEGLQ